MCKIAATFLFLLAVITAAKADTLRLPTLSECDSNPQNIIDLVQEKYNEVPFVEGQGGIISLNGQYMVAEFKMFLNPDTKSFSIVTIDPVTGAGCLYFAGNNLKPSITGDDI